ncbi:MAG TPA: nitroreductase family protein [Clostridia bacterium]|nr:nitroreductase family protein [Clostridia bacterium]
MTRDVFEAIKERRSTRAFKEDEVPLATITRLVEAACHAPSAGNIQPWQFYIVTDTEKKKSLVKAALGQGFLAQAPVVIVVCAEPERSASRYGQRGSELYCLQDTAAAVQNILLGANALGLGTCWVGAFNEGEVARVLRLPQELRPVALVPVGHPAGDSRMPSRRPVKDVVHLVGE